MGWENLDAGRLARRLHVTRKHLCDVLTGRATGSLPMLAAIGSALGMRTGVLLERIEELQREREVHMRGRGTGESVGVYGNNRRPRTKEPRTTYRPESHI
jgi:plasmid maintenance system antidote protein VapI